MARSATPRSGDAASPRDKMTSTGGANPPGRAASLFTLSPQDQARICPLLASLIRVGNNPPVIPGSTMWIPKELARWYAGCAGLGALLSAALSGSNPWQSTLSGGDPTKDDPQYQYKMLGTLESIQEFLACSLQQNPMPKG